MDITLVRPVAIFRLLVEEGFHETAVEMMQRFDVVHSMINDEISLNTFLHHSVLLYSANQRWTKYLPLLQQYEKRMMQVHESTYRQYL